jgi:hypothetical protein
MENILSLKEAINSIGERLVACQNYCAGVTNDLGKGVLPRCLVLETNGRSYSQGAVIVGINPAESNGSERDFYIKNGATYDQVVSYWTRLQGSNRYYTKMHHLINALEIGGPLR